MVDGFIQAFGLLVLLLAGALTWLVWHWRARLRLWHHFGLVASVHRFPGRIRLRPLPEFRWLKGERAPQRVQAFHAAGFADVGGFAVDELPHARLFVLHHPALGFFGLVHECGELGTWSDVLAFRPDECQPVLASSILKQSYLYLLPGDPKIHRPAAAEADLVNAVQQASSGPVQSGPATASEFQARFEDAFALAVDRRLLEPLEDYELRRLLRDRNSCLADDDGLAGTEFALLKRLLPAAINNELRLACSAQFLRETTLPASDWHQARERLAVIHDRTPLDELAGRLVHGVCWTSAWRKRLRRARRLRGSPREVFARLNALLPPWERYKKIGEVNRPVPADIYRAPLEGQRS